MNRRPAFTLIEMVAVTGICTLLTGIAVLMLHALMKNHDGGRNHLKYQRTVGRLAEQFRDDVHKMQKTSPDAGENVLELAPESATGAKISYRCLADRIDREELLDGKIVARDSYIMPPDMEASIKTQSRNDATVVCLIVSPKRQLSIMSRQTPARIEAVLDRDARLTKTPPAPEDKQ